MKERKEGRKKIMKEGRKEEVRMKEDEGGRKKGRKEGRKKEGVGGWV